MAPGVVATNGMALSAENLRVIAECEKIVRFRDEVFAGTHPRVKLAHPVVKQAAAARNTSSPSIPSPQANGMQQSQSQKVAQNTNISPSYNNRSPNTYRATTNGHTPMSSKSEINPILLEKSEDLIKAEMQLQRQRLERGLRDQIEHQRLETKALLQTSESLPSFDLTEVLSKALAIVHPSIPADVEPSLDASASDSFDENTFYSSEHNTPEASPPKFQNEPSVTQSQVASSATGNRVNFFSTQGQAGDREAGMPSALLSNGSQLTPQPYSHSQQLPSQQQNMGSRPTSVMEASRNIEGVRKETYQTTVSTHQYSFIRSNAIPLGHTINQSETQTAVNQPEITQSKTSPLIRAHNLSPFAPQPARVSPLITTRDNPILRDALAADEVTPAQVSALRHEPAGISSSNSSPRGAGGSEKKKGRKERREERKKRKASNGGNADTPDLIPYIKPEPRSPSPFPVAPLPRPQKRQRQVGQYAAELNYDEPRYEPVELVQERVPDRFKEISVARTYDRYDDRYGPEPRRPEPVYQRVDRDDAEYHRVSVAQNARRPESPSIYNLPYAPDSRSVRAVSHVVADRRVYDEPVYYREPIRRASVRPDVDRERSRSPTRERRSPIPMGPPRRPLRIYVDEFGREYIDPETVAPPRQSMAPPSRYRDSEAIHERAPPRTIPARPPVEYEEDGVIYRRPSPVIVAPRRVVAQPEYAPPEYRSYRQREYSVRPSAMPPPPPPSNEDYVQVREARQMSHFEEAPRQYIARAPSVHPDAVRYEVPREYVSRQQSMRPELPSETIRYEVREAPLREYSVRPETYRVPPREYLPERGERYYDEAQRPIGEENRRPVPSAEVAYIERPRVREASVMMYADDARREVYR
jgi:hypothetical protein